jgi:hypothetical protein
MSNWIGNRRSGKRWKSKFARFVGTYGPPQLAKDLGCAPSAIYSWVRAATRPKPEYCELIQRIARDRGISLTFDNIYAHSRDLRAVDRTLTLVIERRKDRQAAHEAKRAAERHKLFVVQGPARSQLPSRV